MRRLALLLPFNSEKKLLLQHRTADAPRKPDHWGFFGGHIEEGETPETAARREFREELGMENVVLTHLFTITVAEPDDLVEKNFFTTYLDEDEAALKPKQKEGDNLGYFLEDELDGLKITPEDKMVMKAFFKPGR